MDSQSIREDARLYFLPVILGNGREAHSLASRIYRRYRTVSYMLADKRSLRDSLSLCCRFIPLHGDPRPEIVCGALIALCEQNPYRLPILIPTEPRYSRAVEKFREHLEPYFVFSDPESILSDSPLTRLCIK